MQTEKAVTGQQEEISLYPEALGDRARSVSTLRDGAAYVRFRFSPPSSDIQPDESTARIPPQSETTHRDNPQSQRP